MRQALGPLALDPKVCSWSVASDAAVGADPRHGCYSFHGPKSSPGGDMRHATNLGMEKSMYGRQYMGVERSTFLVGAGGRIEREWRKVKVNGHAAEVLAAL